MTKLTSQMSIGINEFNGNYSNKSESSLLKIREVSDIKIFQITQYKNSKLDISLIKIDNQILSKMSGCVSANFNTRILWSGPKTWIVISKNKNIIDDITKKVGIYHLSKYDYFFWSQLYLINGYHGPHNHAGGKGIDINAHISWVHFLDVPEQKCFRFTDTKGNILIPDEQSNGDIICFPNWVWHEVVPLKTDYLRLVVAGNICFTSHNSL